MLNNSACDFRGGIMRGGSAPRSVPLNLLYTIFGRNGKPFVYFPLMNGAFITYPLTDSLLVIVLKCCLNKPNWHSHKSLSFVVCRCVGLIYFCLNFITFSYTQLTKSLPSYILSSKKVQSLPSGSYYFKKCC